MLYRPVYVKNAKMHEALIPKGKPKRERKRTPQPPPTPPPPPEEPQPKQEQEVEEEEEHEHLPMLITTNGNRIVLPKEATRQVLSGRVAYYLVDDTGMTLFKPKHVFAALKLDKEHIHRFEDYSCVGAHERFLPRRPPKREGLGYRRRFISPELIGRGIYVSRFLVVVAVVDVVASFVSWASILLRVDESIALCLKETMEKISYDK